MKYSYDPSKLFYHPPPRKAARKEGTRVRLFKQINSDKVERCTRSVDSLTTRSNQSNRIERRSGAVQEPCSFNPRNAIETDMSRVIVAVLERFNESICSGRIAIETEKILRSHSVRSARSSNDFDVRILLDNETNGSINKWRDRTLVFLPCRKTVPYNRLRIQRY